MQNTTLTVLELIEINQPDRPQTIAQPAPPQPGKPFLCRHIFTDGRRCGSPALRGQHFCYYHQTHRTPVLANERRRQPKSGFDLTRLDGLDNPTAIQLALSEILGRIANNSIDPKSAWLLIYGLQVAARNLRHSRPNEEPLPDAIVEDYTHGQLAELETGRTVPESNITRMCRILEQQKIDPDFPIPDEFKDLIEHPQKSRLRHPEVQT